MNGPLHALVALDQAVDRRLVETLLTSSARLSVVDYVDLDDDSSGAERSDVLLVACSDYTSAVSDYIAATSQSRPGRPVVLLAPINGNGHVADAMGRGADDVVTMPDGDLVQAAGQLVFALEKAVARKRGAAAQTSRDLGEMICILGLKGGSGKTLTAANLAVSLADAGHRVTAVDLDLQFGDLGLALGLTPERTLYDLLRAGGSLDVDKLGDFMAVHDSGLRVLLAPTRPDQAGAITPDFLREVFPLLREMSDYVIVDTPPVFTPEVIAAVDSSTAVCMVAMLDSLSLKNTKLGFETLELMEYDSDKVRLVLNRADSKVGIGIEDTVAIMGRAPATLIPSDRNIARSINRGEPISLASRRSEAARAFHELADLYVNDREPVPASAPTQRRRLFRR